MQVQPQSRYAEPDNRDWRSPSEKVQSSTDERSWIVNREIKESRQHDSNQGTQGVFFLFFDII